MADRSAIEWTDATWTPIRARNRATGAIGWHCEHASEGCRNCYAEALNRDRLGTRLPFKPGHRVDVDVYLDEAMLLAPLRWRRPRRVFVCSMTDLFADFVPDAMIDCVFAVMALAPLHTFQLLTKRPERMRAYLSDPAVQKRLSLAIHDVFVANRCRGGIDVLDYGFRLARWPLPNVWLGTSCEDQPTADARMPELLATLAVVHFVSAEPLLGPIDVSRAVRCNGPWYRNDIGLDWIIVGGESGPHSRPMHPQWARAIRDQCAAAGVAFHFKQWGAWAALRDPGDGEWPTDLDGFCRLTSSGDRQDGGWPMQLVGKKHAGRLLDGVEHNGMPPGIRAAGGAS